MLRKVCKRKLKILAEGVNILRKVKRACALDPSKNKNPFTVYVKGVNICRNVIRNPAQNTIFYSVFRGSICSVFSNQKGGCILNMLKNMVGDSAFFKSLNLYLKTKKFQSAEAHDLRLAFEEVTGEDMNWFWNQWYFASGHPKLNISYDYDSAAKNARVIIAQTQTGKTFRFRIAVDIYQGPQKERHYVWVESKADTLSFPAATKPDLINADGDKILHFFSGWLFSMIRFGSA